MKIKVLKVEPKKAPYIDEIENVYESLTEYVGGYIEFVRLDEDTCIVCNEEGKLIGLEPNRYIYGGADVVCGNFLIVGDDHEGDSCSLTDEQLKKWTEVFLVPQEINPDDVQARLTFIPF